VRWQQTDHELVQDFNPGSGEVKKCVELPYPNSSGVLSTAGGIVETALLDGLIIAALEMIALGNTTVQR
jgi:hypothetical protein